MRWICRARGLETTRTRRSRSRRRRWITGRGRSRSASTTPEKAMKPLASTSSTISASDHEHRQEGGGHDAVPFVCSPPAIMRCWRPPARTCTRSSIGIKRMIAGGDGQNEWNIVMATAILAMLPPALVVVLMQKWFVKGLVDTEKIKRQQANNRHLWLLSYATSSSATATGRRPARCIHGVSAEIADHEFIVIVGPSGCGKSTLLRMVAGLEDAGAAQIAIGGKVVNELEPSERDIAMVFQNYALYPHMSVFENMAYGLKIAKVPKDEIKTRVDKAAKILELGHLLERKPRELSRRPAPARGHGPRHRAPAAGLPVRRAAVQPRRQAARADAPRNPEAAPRARHHLAVRHPRPGRGHDAGAAHHRDERAAAWTSSARPRRSTTAPPPPSWRASSARRR